MPDLSAFIPEAYRDISPGYVETLLQTQREELFTGLVRLTYPSGINLVFTFVEGNQQKLYQCHENEVEVIPIRTWFSALDHSSAIAGLLRLPVEPLRFMRLAYEAPVLRVERFTFRSEELTYAAERWAVDQDASLVHVQSDKVNRYYLIAGHSNPIIEELSFVQNQAHVSITDPSFPRSLSKADYAVIRYVSNRQYEVWREYELRFAFNPFMHILLSRFNDLGGRALTERLCERLSLWAREGGCNIVVTANGVVNRQYFDSLESASGNYTGLLRQFRHEATPAIGPRMVDGISQEAFVKLDPYRRELLAQYVYDQPDVGSVSGGLWR